MMMTRVGVLLVVVAVFGVVSAERIPIKINSKPSSGFNWGGGGAANPYNTWGTATNANGAGATGAPVPIRAAAAVSGPTSLQALHGECFGFTDSQYRYDICPFANVTQRDRSLAAGSLHVLMGVWNRWRTRETEDGEEVYVGMFFDDGTSCASGRRRSTDVALQCGEEYAVSHVSEPESCVYEMIFTLPEFCNTANMLVGQEEYGGAVEYEASVDDAMAMAKLRSTVEEQQRTMKRMKVCIRALASVINGQEGASVVGLASCAGMLDDSAGSDGVDMPNVAAT